MNHIVHPLQPLTGVEPVELPKVLDELASVVTIEP